ncbi:M24 family metallopeptidase [Thermoactinomyces mirandus]|uniref:Aminopeptidase P family protein n=1 Tax=Thermoactinomyces mirandus TaxID=2756294 RepID=A0A7W2AQ13_9BACL|nr:Xaa-Pro peptidase family protein [Thermoactinomyces mirandus]MBA4600802.1 aminopeptidase P family protein [Thermoactinomyces mirandus]
MNQRIDKITTWLKNESIDVAFVHSSENVFYLSNFMCHPNERLLGLFVFAESDPFLVCPRMEEQAAKDAGWSHKIISYDDVEDPWEMIRTEWKHRSLQEESVIAIEKDVVSYARAEKLQTLSKKVQFRSLDDTLNQLRLVKDAAELEILREAARLADEAIQVGIDHLTEACTEMDVLAAIELAMKKKGVADMSFPTMVLFGEKSALPHGHPGLRRLKKGDLVLFDLGVVWNGYCSDITRTVAFDRISEQQREIYEVVKEAQQAAIDALKPGVRVGDLDRIARNRISKAGYGNCFTHRLGHGLGISVHEFPSVNETNDHLLKEGMVFTIEPGIYVPEAGGVRIEDDVCITEDGAEILTSFTKELVIV